MMDEERNTAEMNVLTENAPAEPFDAAEPYETAEPSGAAELPAAFPGTEPAENTGSLRRIVRTVFFRVLPSALLVTAVTVYAVLAVTSLTETEFTVTRVLRTMLGEFTGGADYVRFTETAALPSADMQENTGTLPPALPESPGKPSETVAEPELSGFTPEFPIYRLDMSSQSEHALGLVNETPYEVDLNALAAADRAVPPYHELAETYGSGAPVVLILHTHATESDADTYADDFRSLDSSGNVTAVGALVAERLTENGIGVIHCTETFDYPDFNMAYYNAALAIRQYIADYPSISYVIDIHRDSILSGETYVSPVTELDGVSAAQIMFVVGTDHGGSGHTGWRDNLALAARLQKSLHGDCPTLMRDINLRSASFNEQYTPGSLLVEIGSCASTPEEVLTAAGRFADHLAAEILGS